LDADYPEKGVLIPCRNSVLTDVLLFIGLAVFVTGIIIAGAILIS
jgi:hypothetical protein